MFHLGTLFDRSFLSGGLALALGAGQPLLPPRPLRSHGLDLVKVGTHTRRHGGRRPHAIATAAADLGDRLAGVTILKTGNLGKTEVSHEALLRLIPRAGATIDRRDLTDRAEIVERMARDILAARRDGQHGHLIDLTEFGWSPAQAMRWGTAAHEAARSPAIATQDAVERLRESDGAYAVSPFDVDRIVAAGDAAGAAALAGEGDDATDTGGAAA